MDTTSAGRPIASLPAAMLFLVACAMLPDADVIAFSLELPYSHPLAHRGVTHSLTAALLVGLMGGVFGRRVLRASWPRVTFLITGVVASHGLLDMFTDGGAGIAWLWPLSGQRFFAPWHPIPVSPIGFNFLSSRGLFVTAVEVIYFLPLLAYSFWPQGGLMRAWGLEPYGLDADPPRRVEGLDCSPELGP